MRVGEACAPGDRERALCSRPRSAAWLRPGAPSGSRGRSRRACRSSRVYDSGYDGVLRSLEQTPARLGLAAIDILLIHDVDLSTHGRRASSSAIAKRIEGAYPALDRLRSEGVVKAVGIGVNESSACLRFARDGDFDCFLLAGRYTLLEQARSMTLLPLCERRGIGICRRRPLQFRHPRDRAGRRRRPTTTRRRRRRSSTGCAGSRRSAQRHGVASRPRRCSSRSPIRRSAP